MKPLLAASVLLVAVAAVLAILLARSGIAGLLETRRESMLAS